MNRRILTLCKYLVATSILFATAPAFSGVNDHPAFKFKSNKTQKPWHYLIGSRYLARKNNKLGTIMLQLLLSKNYWVSTFKT